MMGEAGGSKQTIAITCCSEQIYNLGRLPLSPSLMVTSVISADTH